MLKLLVAAALAAGGPERAQAPSWTDDDMRFFLHGTMGTEFVPESSLLAFMDVFPELFPGRDLSSFGLISAGPAELPLGLTRRQVRHLGGQVSIGFNCASCHLGSVQAGGEKPLRVLGMAAPFDAESFVNAVLLSAYRTMEPEGMRRYLERYFAHSETEWGAADAELFARRWREQRKTIEAAISRDPGGARGAGEGGLHSIDQKELQFGPDLASAALAHLRVFHNMRRALHVPDEPPAELPPASGPGRNNAFGLLSAGLFGEPILHAPSKFGYLWNLKKRDWVHWDGNARRPVDRNLIAALGVGAPMVGKRGLVDMRIIERHTKLTEVIAPPRYPFEIDSALARRGRRHFRKQCASCHPSWSWRSERLYRASEIGTDPARLDQFGRRQADLYNRFFQELQVAGYPRPRKPNTIRSTQKFLGVRLSGVWARAPYLHNGSVRTLRELLSPASERPRSFRRGSNRYDPRGLGFADEGSYVFDSSKPGNSNAGHEYGTALTPDEKDALLEYLKTL